MNDDLNPFSSFQPGNLFVGYADEVRQVIRGFANGRSFAVLGGHRCGKTSFLLEIQRAVEEQGVFRYRPFARVVDLSATTPHSATEFFAGLYREITREVEGAGEWAPAAGLSQPYQEFLYRLRQAVPTIERRYGADWLVVLLVDKLDLAKGQDRLDLDEAGHKEIFSNLRNFLSLDQLRRNFRLVGTGGSDTYRLVTQGSPLANILDPIWLRALSQDEAGDLIAKSSLNASHNLRSQLFSLTGRHPFLLQGFLERLWNNQDAPDELSLSRVRQAFLRDRSDVFERWTAVLGRDRCMVYQRIAESNGSASVSDLRRRSRVDNIDEALRVLSFHGVIDDSSDPDHPVINGTMFRDWFMRNAAVEATTPALEPVPATKRKRFAVAFSFPGETRDRVKHIALLLAAELTRDRVLYDEFYESEFAIRDLDTYLQKLYRDESELVVVVLCEKYETKMWTGLEWRAIRDILNQRKQPLSTMFLRTDDGEVGGVFSLDGYVDLRRRSNEDAARLILERLRSLG